MSMSEWKEYRLGDICETNKSQYSNKENWHHFKYLDTGNIDNIQEFDSFESLPSRARRKVTDGDIIYSSVRPNQEHYGYISNPSADILVSTGFIVISANKDIINPIFLYNYLTQPIITKYLQAIGEQSVCTYPAIKPSDIEDLVIKIPSLDIQAIIASILSSLDSKIENNRKICANLEAQAQALFKHWFIDFAPFKDGKFVESELGMIPEGWRVGTLTEIADFMNGLAMQKFPPLSEEDAIPVLKIKELGQSRLDNNSDKCSKQIKSEYIIKDGDVIFSWSGTLLVDIWCGGICGLNQHLFKVTSNEYPKWFFFFWTKYHLTEFIRIAKDKAVTMGHIKRGDLEKALVVIPDKYTFDKISELIEEILIQIINVRLESSRLSTLRDTLLPKLMSGEIKV